MGNGNVCGLLPSELAALHSIVREARLLMGGRLVQFDWFRCFLLPYRGAVDFLCVRFRLQVRYPHLGTNGHVRETEFVDIV